MWDTDFNFKLGQYVFLSYSRQDQKALFHLKLIQYLARHFHIMIDCGNEWGFDDETMRAVKAFKYGEDWRRQIQEGASKAHCILALCSKNMREQLELQPDSWLSEELRIGRESGTIFPISIDQDVDLYERSNKSFWKRHLGEGYAADQGPRLRQVLHRQNPRLEPVFEQIMEAISSQFVKKGEALRKEGGRREFRQTIALRTLINRNRQAQAFVHASTAVAVAEAWPLSKPENLIARFVRVDLPDAELCRLLDKRKDKELLERHADLIVSELIMIRNRTLNKSLEIEYQKWRDHQLVWPELYKSPDEAAASLLGQMLYQLNGGAATTLAEAREALRKWCETDMRGDASQEACLQNLRESGLFEKAEVVRCTGLRPGRSAIFLRGGFIFGTSCTADIFISGKGVQTVSKLFDVLRDLNTKRIRILIIVYTDPKGGQKGWLKYLSFKTQPAVAPKFACLSPDVVLPTLGDIAYEELGHWCHLVEYVVDHDVVEIKEHVRRLFEAEVQNRGAAQWTLPMEVVIDMLKNSLDHWPRREQLNS